MKNIKKILFTLLIILLITGCNTTKKTETIIKDGTAKNEVKVSNITFSDIKINNSNGITNISAIITSNSNEEKDIVVTTILKDKDGNTVSEVKQIVENFSNKQSQNLKTGIVGDYDISKVEFKVE